MSSDSPYLKVYGGHENGPRCRQLSTLLPLSHTILAVSIEGVRLNAPWQERRPLCLKVARVRHFQRTLPHLLLAGVGAVGTTDRRGE
jgi:hypothetical protein